MAESGDTKWYKFTSTKNPSTHYTERLILEGSYEDPKRMVEIGQVGEFTEDEYRHYRQFANLREVQVDDLEGAPFGLGFGSPEKQEETAAARAREQRAGSSGTTAKTSSE